MSVVAYDGKSLAADRQATCNDMRATTSKIIRVPCGDVLAWTGQQDAGLMMVDWYQHGKQREHYPPVQNTDYWARLIVATQGRVEFYERHPLPIRVYDPFMAWGSGQDFAMGALAMGATAKEAVEVASRFSVNCGCGVEVYEL